MDDKTRQYISTLMVKGSTGSDLSLLNHPNLEADRVMLEFLDMVVDETALLKSVTTLRRKEHKGEIVRLDTCDTTAVAACASDCLPNFEIQDSYLTYDLVKYVVHTSYDQDMLDHNKFGPAIKDIQMRMLVKSLANSMERAAISGDTDLPTGKGQSKLNNLLGFNDGWLKLACSCVPDNQVIDAEGAGPSTALFMAARTSLPSRYKINRGSYRFVGGPSLNDWLASHWASRITAKGDQALETGQGGNLWGNEFFEAPLWPEEMAYSSQDVTHILYTPLDNLVHIVQREPEFHTEYDMSCDKFKTAAYFRQDVMIYNPESMVLIKNVDLCSTAPFDGCRTTNSSCGIINTNPC